MQKRQLIVLTVLLCLLQSTYAQPAIKKFVEEHAQHIVAVDPDSINFTDLGALVRGKTKNIGLVTHGGFAGVIAAHGLCFVHEFLRVMSAVF